MPERVTLDTIAEILELADLRMSESDRARLLADLDPDLDEDAAEEAVLEWIEENTTAYEVSGTVTISTEVSATVVSTAETEARACFTTAVEAGEFDTDLTEDLTRQARKNTHTPGDITLETVERT